MEQTTSYDLLNKIDSPEDLRKLSVEALPEVCNQLRNKVIDARLRPILMTVLTCVFGMIPLMLSHGVGANGNSTLGSGVVGGMIVGTLALLFLVPTLFIVFQTLQEKIKPVEFTSPDWCIQAEIEENQKEPIDEEAKTDDDTK